jgi:hypothetical protein
MARKTREVPATDGISIATAERELVARGRAAPTAKDPAEANAA